MRRMILVLTIAAVMALMMSLAASPALATPPFQAVTGLCKAFAKSGGHAQEPLFCPEPV